MQTHADRIDQFQREGVAFQQFPKYEHAPGAQIVSLKTCESCGALWLRGSREAKFCRRCLPTPQVQARIVRSGMSAELR